MSTPIQEAAKLRLAQDRQKALRATAETVLAEAQAFADNCRQEGKRPSWTDYQRYEDRLVCAGCYGYEGRLADILGL